MTPRPQTASEAVTSAYTFICLTALGLVLFLLVQRGFGRWSLIPVLIGMLAMAFRWPNGPLLFVLTLAGLVILAPADYSLFIMESGWFRRRAPRPEPGPQVRDWLLCVAVLAFTAAHYRLQSLLSFILPPDPRSRRLPQQRPSSWLAAPVVRHRRTAVPPPPWEIGYFLLGLLLWAAVAQFVWAQIPRRWVLESLGDRSVSRVVLLTWLVGCGLILTAAVSGYFKGRQATPPEAALYLQDQFWNQTRREQRRLNSWLSWLRRRSGR